MIDGPNPALISHVLSDLLFLGRVDISDQFGSVHDAAIPAHQFQTAFAVDGVAVSLGELVLRDLVDATAIASLPGHFLLQIMGTLVGRERVNQYPYDQDCRDDERWEISYSAPLQRTASATQREHSDHQSDGDNQSCDADQALHLLFLSRFHPWVTACFGAMIAGGRAERNHGFLEEALELVQHTVSAITLLVAAMWADADDRDRETAR